jgi:hypothetical protein
MTEVSGKRKAETGLWEQYKPLLQFFFIDQNRTLKEVRDVMAKSCGFDRKCVTFLRLNEKPSRLTYSRAHEYELRFKNWGFRKNFSGEEWREAKSLMDKRKLNGKSSTIMSGGRIIKRAQKRVGHHAYETIYERLRRQMSMQALRKEI